MMDMIKTAVTLIITSLYIIWFFFSFALMLGKGKLSFLSGFASLIIWVAILPLLYDIHVFLCDYIYKLLN